MLTDNTGARIANTETIGVGPCTMASLVSSQGPSAFIDAAGTVERHRQVCGGSMPDAGPIASNWTRACHALRLPRWN
jgi:hypothetical protein